MRTDQREALAAVARRFVDVEFVVGGSAMLSLLGADVAVADLDIVASPESRTALRQAAGEWWRGARHEQHPNLDSSWLADLEVNGVAVDVMGGLTLVAGDVRWRVPMRRGSVVEVNGVDVALAAVGPWIALYSLYRPSRVAQLQPYLSPLELELTRSEVPTALGIEWPQAALLPTPEETP